jgi:hypothetical protein
MNQEPTNQDILEAINIFSNKVEERFSNLENDVSGLKDDVSGLKDNVSNIWGTINTQMVTKDYLDDKIADLRGEPFPQLSL